MESRDISVNPQIHSPNPTSGSIEGSDDLDFDEEAFLDQLNSDKHDDEDFVKHTDANVEYGGLDNENVGLENAEVQAHHDEELNMSDVGNYPRSGTDSEDDTIWPKFCPQAEMKDPTWKVSLTFKDKQEFKEALTSHAIKEGKEFFFEKDDKQRLVVKCQHDSCPWQLTLRFRKDLKMWMITVFKGKHDGCVRTQKNKMVNSTIIAKRWKQEIKGHMDWKTNSFMDKVCTDDHLSLSKKQAWRALVKAKSDIKCEDDKYFNKIWSYHREIQITNPQSTCEIKVSDLEEDGKQRFQRMYMCWEASKIGYKHCRKLIGLDGCHLKCKTGGQLLTAVGIDGNECIFPLGYAIVENENKDSWTWFLNLLKKDLEIDITSEQDLTMMSDKQKGLIQAIRDVMPGVEHRFCVRHLHNNMIVAGFTSIPIRDALWKLAKASTVNSFKSALLELRKLDEEAYKWLNSDKNPSEYSRSHFSPAARCDMLVNNISESFNLMILDGRRLPVISCMEWIRKKLMTRFFDNRTKAEKWTGVVCPNIAAKVDKAEKEAGGFNGYQCDTMLFEVIGMNGQWTVDVCRRSCSCKKWELTGIPCPHAVLAIWMKYGKGPIWHYVDPCNSTQTYLKTYNGCIKPMSGYEEWPEVNKEPPLPPVYNARHGRPTTLRKKSAGEVSNGSKVSKGPQVSKGVYLSRKHVPLTCSKCKKSGHNARTCPEYPTVRLANQNKRGRKNQPPNDINETQSQTKAPNVITQTETQAPFFEDDECQDPIELLNEDWQFQDIYVQSEGGTSMSTTLPIHVEVNQSEPVLEVPVMQPSKSGMQVPVPVVKPSKPSIGKRKVTTLSGGARVMLPHGHKGKQNVSFKKPRQVPKQYVTRTSCTFKSKFFGNDDEPIDLDL